MSVDERGDTPLGYVLVVGCLVDGKKVEVKVLEERKVEVAGDDVIAKEFQRCIEELQNPQGLTNALHCVVKRGPEYVLKAMVEVVV